MDLLKEGAKEIAGKIFSITKDEVTRIRNVEEGLQRLRRTKGRINALLKDAEERRYIDDDSVKEWLRDLKFVSFETEDLIDKYQTDVILHKHGADVGSSRSRKRKLGPMTLNYELPSWGPKWYQINYKVPSLGPEWGPFHRWKFASEISEIENRLEEIAKSRKNLRLRGEDGARRERANQSAPTYRPGPEQDLAIIIGRETEKDRIVELLISDQRVPEGVYGGKVIPVVPIHGTPGIGKTTLARCVYDDYRIHSHFDSKAWVSLTDRCDASDAMKKIYQNITGQTCDFRGLDTLHNRLRSYLKRRGGKKILLVIDNLWASDLNFWDTLRVPLLDAGEGSKVLITTRYDRTFQFMHGLIPQPCLSGLGEEECWQLIKSLALPSSFNSDDDLTPIGREIARRCCGSPMAAKALGVVLNRRNREEWSDVLHEMQALTDDFNGAVLASLKISYHHLPYHLKQCFSYCSIFPNGYIFDRDQVIRYWLAEGLIEPDGRRRLEAVGNKYFDELIWRSFFEKINPDTKDQNAKPFTHQIERYRIPSLMCNLAMLVSQHEFRGLESGKPQAEPSQRNPDQARYAYFLHPKNKDTVKLECLEPYSNLRTLKYCHDGSNEVVPLNSTPASFFLKFVHLRVLDMSNSDLEQVPDSVGKLIQLRYLGLSNTKVTTLPEQICDLFNLQTLELKDCFQLAALPEGLGRLIKLRHLDIHLDWEKITDSTEVALPQVIGQLDDLQTLSRFNVVSGEGQECNISVLRNINLRGELCILNLEKVTMGHANNAKLEEKQFVEKLMLRWHSSAFYDKQVQQQSQEVIKSIQPHNSLRCLWIVHYPGIKFPNWMGNASFSSLQTIRISMCKNFGFLYLLRNLPRLKNLQIDDVSTDILHMPEGFPSLEHLKLLKLSYLQRLFLQYELPQLKQIDISDCADLQELVLHANLANFTSKIRRNCPNLSRISIVNQGEGQVLDQDQD